jgi:ABC-type phosphate/phosphonate transport system substrate-binding protein
MQLMALPMYNVTPALAADWRALLEHVRTSLRRDGLAGELAIVDPPDPLLAFWQRPDLLLSQTCGYPLVRHLRDRVQLVATPVFEVAGCDGPLYRSEIVVAAASGLDRLEACRGKVAAVSQWDSHSGMNALRHAVAPLAADGVFFEAVVTTGSHLGSLQAVADGRADVASIDCVSLAFVRDLRPDLVAAVRVIGHTQLAPGLPLIASSQVPQEVLQAIRVSLDHLLICDAGLAARLKLRRFDTLGWAEYERISRMEHEAQKMIYPRLA